MLPFYIDFNPNQDASTTLNREKTELRIQEIPTSFDEGLVVRLNDFISDELISVYTNLSLSKQRPLEYVGEAFSLDDDLDIISKFQFKNTRKIKARIKKATFSPSMIID